MIAFAARTPSPTRERTRNVAVGIVQAALAVQFALAGVGRLAGGYEGLAGRATRIIAELWLRGDSPESGGAAGVVVPALFALAALGLGAFLVVASMIHLIGLLAWARRPRLLLPDRAGNCQ